MSNAHKSVESNSNGFDELPSNSNFNSEDEQSHLKEIEHRNESTTSSDEESIPGLNQEESYEKFNIEHKEVNCVTGSSGNVFH